MNAAGLLREPKNAKKIAEMGSWESSTAYTADDRLVLAYAEAITRSDHDVEDALFARMRDRFNEGELVELTAWICLENFYSKFNRSFRIAAQGFCVIATEH